MQAFRQVGGRGSGRTGVQASGEVGGRACGRAGGRAKGRGDGETKICPDGEKKIRPDGSGKASKGHLKGVTIPQFFINFFVFSRGSQAAPGWAQADFKVG